MMEKKYKISKTRSNNDREDVIEGTLAELIDQFGPILRQGNSLNSKIKLEPKNIKELLTAAQKSYKEIEKSYSFSTFLDLVK